MRHVDGIRVLAEVSRLTKRSMRNRGLLTWLSSALILGGTAVLGWHYWTLHEAARTQRLAKVLLNRTTAAGQSTPAPEPNKNSVRRGYMIGELSIPRLHMSVMVFEGDDARI